MVPAFYPDRPFDLPLLPPPIDFRNPIFFDTALKARTELGEIKGYAAALPNPMLLLSPAIIKESVASSSIENINTTVEKVLQQNIFPDSERDESDKEVLRYRNAISAGFGEMRDLPLSSRLIEIIHGQLMQGKVAGFRKTQNHIQNSQTGKILYTPPPANTIPMYIADLEKFIHEQDGFDPLIKCAVLHYQFEAIHPFLDGNGRTGRILMVLYLIHSGLLNLPILYISGYINEKKAAYYEHLNSVSRDGTWMEYVLFILEGFYTQALATKNVLFRIMGLYEEIKGQLKKNHKKIYNTEMLATMFAAPILSPVGLAEVLKIHYTTATRYLTELREAGLLTDLHSGKYHLFINHRLMKIISD